MRCGHKKQSLTPKREEKFKRVIKQSQGNITVVLENVHDTHNIGAVLRSADSIGIREIYVVYTEERHSRDYLKLGKRTSGGTRKWVKVNYYNDIDACYKAVKDKYKLILGTYLKEGEVSTSMFDLDLTQSVALVFGNEAKGMTQKSIDYCDGNFIIPQVGMVTSLNISVACAVTLYEAYRQRLSKNYYEDNPTLSPTDIANLEEKFEVNNKIHMSTWRAPRID